MASLMCSTMAPPWGHTSIWFTEVPWGTKVCEAKVGAGAKTNLSCEDLLKFQIILLRKEISHRSQAKLRANGEIWALQNLHTLFLVKHPQELLSSPDLFSYKKKKTSVSLMSLQIDDFMESLDIIKELIKSNNFNI